MSPLRPVRSTLVRFPLFRRAVLGAALCIVGVAAFAQSTGPASGPDGTSPGAAPAPEAMSTSPGAPTGPRVASPGTSGPGYGTVSAGTSPRSVPLASPESAAPPEAVVSSPGTAIAPREEVLRASPSPRVEQGLPRLQRETAISAPGIAPGTPRATVAPTRQPRAPVVSPEDLHAPAVDNAVPTVASPLKAP